MLEEVAGDDGGVARAAHPDEAASLRKGLEETLTVRRLGSSPA
jgi:hypothetical protein